jgi:hypothetical protein
MTNNDIPQAASIDTVTDAAPISPRNLPAIESHRLKPCAGCNQPLGPTWWMVRPVRCMVDGQGVRDRAGLNLIFGSHALAEVFAGNPVAREFDHLPELCICERCASHTPLAAIALGACS